MRSKRQIREKYFLHRSARAIKFFPWRFRLVLLGFFLLIIALVVRMVYLTVYDRNFLRNQGDARSLRVINIPASRGMILDREGEPLAVSAPVDSIWINPRDFPNTGESLAAISRLLHLSTRHIAQLVHQNTKREFLYIKRGVNPALADAVKSLAIPGVYLEREYKRYYPIGEVSAQVVGITNIDDQGEEGLELAYNDWLQGIPGKERVLKDRYGKVVAILSRMQAAQPGRDLTISLDNRLQFLAYRALKETIHKFNAQSGSVVVLNSKTGEVLAMVNQPSYNPNNRARYNYGQFRNRAVTDLFEPGSTMKAFSVVSALDSGKYTPYTLIDTKPGWFKVGVNKIRDEHFHRDRSVMTVTDVLRRSSNVGVAKMTLSLPKEHFLKVLKRVGFGSKTQSGFPGESPGQINDRVLTDSFVLATLAFGYGISVTPLQLAHAYAVLANKGLNCPVTFLKREDSPTCVQAINPNTASNMLTMLESATHSGTGRRAKIAYYRIAGKTGTAYIAGKNGYDTTRHTSSFVGIAPVGDPQLVVAVIIRDPKGASYGSVVAAPAFAKIMGPALRILNVSPDGSIK